MSHQTSHHISHHISHIASRRVLNGADSSLGFILATEGYDVYLGNSRGNKYCLNHTTYSTKNNKFWHFSWDEMAAYDVPAFVDYILEATGKSSLAYVCHSQGCTQMFAALVSQPDLTHKIHSLYTLAPVAYLAHATSPMIIALSHSRLDQLVFWMGGNQFFPSSTLLTLLMPALCSNPLTSWTCTSYLWLVTGFSRDEFNLERMSVYMSHMPSGTSMQNVEHWAQAVRDYDGYRSDFGHYNYVRSTNLKVYGSEVPPIYNLTNFPASTTDLLVFSGGHDSVANPVDVQRLINDLPKRPFWKTLEKYDHVTFLWERMQTVMSTDQFWNI
eukprot:c11504_g1_i2.p1 GENE.c11504_g1_i2~~c11504_g1_i2.p1  ORF type:complete len:328 (-),score=45.14 c11504_g1_i2:304-1287(-)